MPEIKHQFTKGKMNKDLDERLVPNGEYRDAMNIQIRTTSGGDAFSSESSLVISVYLISILDDFIDASKSLNLYIFSFGISGSF